MGFFVYWVSDDSYPMDHYGDPIGLQIFPESVLAYSSFNDDLYYASIIDGLLVDLCFRRPFSCGQGCGLRHQVTTATAWPNIPQTSISQVYSTLFTQLAPRQYGDGARYTQTAVPRQFERPNQSTVRFNQPGIQQLSSLLCQTQQPLRATPQPSRTPIYTQRQFSVPDLPPAYSSNPQSVARNNLNPAPGPVPATLPVGGGHSIYTPNPCTQAPATSTSPSVNLFKNGPL